MYYRRWRSMIQQTYRWERYDAPWYGLLARLTYGPGA
jgi:hypothetical protein